MYEFIEVEDNVDFEMEFEFERNLEKVLEFEINIDDVNV